jgi:hypothetical protein
MCEATRIRAMQKHRRMLATHPHAPHERELAQRIEQGIGKLRAQTAGGRGDRMIGAA